MPLIITPDKWEKWLSPLSKEDITGMMQPLKEGLLKAHPVSKMVYAKGVDANVPEIILPA